jgi:hypothetical protein
VRQHYGVLVLYQRKAGETDRNDARIDALALYVCLLAPVVGFALANPRTLAMLGRDEPPTWAHAVATLAWTLVGTAVAVLAARQVARWRSDHAIHWTKLAFLTAATSVSMVLFAPPVAARAQYEAIVPIVTSFHDVQYLAIVWFFHRNRLARVQRGRATAPLVARSLVAFLGAGLVFTLGYRVALGCAFSAWPGCGVGAENVSLPAGLTVSDLGVAFLWGFALHHYYLDQRIWHVRRDAAVSRDLRLRTAA